jgi:MFS transporter, MHS family, proline/betaine transporter
VIVGSLSQSIGRKLTFIIIGIVAVVALPWLYLQLAATKDVTIITGYALAIAFIGNAGYAPVLIFLNERFPTAFRATGTGLSWNIGFALGGMMPTVVTFFSSAPADIPNWLAIFTAGIFVIYLIGSLVVPETKGEFQ